MFQKVLPPNIGALFCGKKEENDDDTENVEEDDRELTDVEDNCDDDSEN